MSATKQKNLDDAPFHQKSVLLNRCHNNLPNIDNIPSQRPNGSTRRQCHGLAPKSTVPQCAQIDLHLVKRRSVLHLSKALSAPLLHPFHQCRHALGRPIPRWILHLLYHPTPPQSEIAKRAHIRHEFCPTETSSRGGHGRRCGRSLGLVSRHRF
jgi:hypothetical protein